jgi:hypothetical protein
MVLPSVNILTFKNKILNVGGFKLLVIKLNENYILNYPLNYIFINISRIVMIIY